MQLVWSPASSPRDFSYTPNMPERLPANSSARPVSRVRTKDNSTEVGVSKPRALVVDDAPDVTEMLAMFLQHAGYEAVMAFSASDALDAARVERFDVVVSDIGMPGMNGYELARALRELPDYNIVPMIAVTGFSMYDDRGRALESGFDAQLTKPINPMALLDLIKRLRD